MKTLGFFGFGKAFQSLVLAVVLLVFFMVPVYSQSDDGWKIASSRSIPGKFGWTTCEVFARELYHRLTAAGGECYLIIFSWDTGQMSGRHAAVVFRDSDDQFWYMDSRLNQPVRVYGSRAEKWIRSMSHGIDTEIVSTTSDSRLRGQYASLSRRERSMEYLAKAEKPRQSMEAHVVKVSTKVPAPEPVVVPEIILYDPQSDVFSDVLDWSEFYPLSMGLSVSPSLGIDWFLAGVAKKKNYWKVDSPLLRKTGSKYYYAFSGNPLGGNGLDAVMLKSFSINDTVSAALFPTDIALN